jgi:hypothetical protein
MRCVVVAATASAARGIVVPVLRLGLVGSCIQFRSDGA